MKRYITVVEVDGTTSTLDVLDTIKRMRRLPELREYRRGHRPLVDVVGAQGYASGRAWPGRRIFMRIDDNLARERVEELILHEVVHYLLPPGVHHGKTFRSTLLRAAREWWPGLVDDVRNEGRTYAMDEVIWQTARMRKVVPSTDVQEVAA
jgi:hypothetical protein